MKTLPLRGLAALALLCLFVPRASALVITSGSASIATTSYATYAGQGVTDSQNSTAALPPTAFSLNLSSSAFYAVPNPPLVPFPGFSYSGLATMTASLVGSADASALTFRTGMFGTISGLNAGVSTGSSAATVLDVFITIDELSTFTIDLTGAAARGHGGLANGPSLSLTNVDTGNAVIDLPSGYVPRQVSTHATGVLFPGSYRFLFSLSGAVIEDRLLGDSLSHDYNVRFAAIGVPDEGNTAMGLAMCLSLLGAFYRNRIRNRRGLNDGAPLGGSAPLLR